MQVTPQMLLTLCPLIFLSGFIDAVAGGGGLISLPAYLICGLPAHLASGTNKLSASMGTLFATISYHRGGKLEKKPAICASVTAILGALLGARLLLIVPPEPARWVLLCAIPLVAVVVLTSKKKEANSRPFDQKQALLCLLIGLVVGLYDGFIGPGTGTFLIILFTMAAGLNMVSASGSAKLVNLASNVGALFMWIMSGQVLYTLALPAGACAIAGGLLGARFAMKKGSPAVRGMLIVVLCLLLARLLWDVLH